jgi:hypothetical protein
MPGALYESKVISIDSGVSGVGNAVDIPQIWHLLHEISNKMDKHFAQQDELLRNVLEFQGDLHYEEIPPVAPGALKASLDGTTSRGSDQSTEAEQLRAPIDPIAHEATNKTNAVRFASSDVRNDDSSGQGSDRHRSKDSDDQSGLVAKHVPSYLHHRSNTRVHTAGSCSTRASSVDSRTGLNRTTMKALSKVGITSDLLIMRRQEPPRTGRLARIMSSRGFAIICVLVIVVDATLEFFNANAEMDYVTQPFESKMCLPSGSTEPSSWCFSRGSADNHFSGIDKFFVVFYVLEISLKFWVHGCYFFINQDWNWNIFDFVIVVLSVAVFIVQSTITNPSGVSFTFVRNFRLLKIAKILRLVRVVHFFGPLRRMFSSIVGSLNTLAWGILTMTFFTYIFALIFVKLISDFLHAENLKSDAGSLDKDSLELFQAYFGSVQRAMLSLHMATTGGQDWYVFYDQLLLVGGHATFVFFIFEGFFRIALFNVITAYFVEESMRKGAPDKDAKALRKRVETIAIRDDLRHLFEHLDADGSGQISFDKFARQMRHKSTKAYFKLLDLNIEDAKMFFDAVLPQGSHTVDLDTFLDACLFHRGPATSLDLHMFEDKVLADLHKLTKNIDKLKKPTHLHNIRSKVLPESHALSGKELSAMSELRVDRASIEASRSESMVHSV